MPHKKNKKGSHYRAEHEIKEPAHEEALDPFVVFTKDCWERWSEHWSDKFSKFDRYYDQWIGKPPQRDEEWQAQFHKKLTWQAEKALVARFHSALWPISAPIEPDATEVQDEFQGILAKSIVAHWFKVGLFSKEFLSSMRSAAIYGTGLFEDDWLVRKEMKPERFTAEMPDFRPVMSPEGQPVLDAEGNVQSMLIGQRTVTRERKRLQVVEDRYRVRKANIFAWRIHPHKLTDDDDLPAIKQEFITFDKLLERQEEAKKLGFKEFENMDKIKEDKFEISTADRERLQKEGTYVDDKNPSLELLHYYGFYKDDKGKNIPTWGTTVNRKYKLRQQPNPFWHQKPPLFHIIWTEDEKASYYGIGVAQIGKEAEDRANINVNIRTDIMKKGARRSGWYNANDKKIKKGQIQKNTPGLNRACSDINNAFKYDEPPPLRTEDYKEEDVAVNDHREVTGATSSLLPSADPKDQPDTLGGMRLVLAESISRLKPDVVMMEMMGIRRMANRAFLLTRQFMTKREAIELVASQDKLKELSLDKIYNMTPKEIIGQVHFHCTGLAESIEKSQNIDKLLKYMEATTRVPPWQAITNYTNIAKRIALWLGFEDVNDFIQMNPFNPYDPQQQQIPGLPGAGGGVPGAQGIPGVPGQGAPQPQGLPPQAINAIAQQMMGAQGAPLVR